MAEGFLQGKVAMITGAGSPIGLGHAMAVGLVRAGARVALLDLNAAWLEQSAADMRSIGGAECALPIVIDITQVEAVDQAVRRTIAELGGLHILVNNAGINQRAAGTTGETSHFWDLSPEAWSRVVAVNLSGAFFMARAVVGHLLAQGWGRIIGVTTSLDTMWRGGDALRSLQGRTRSSSRHYGARARRHGRDRQCPGAGRRHVHQHDRVKPHL